MSKQVYICKNDKGQTLYNKNLGTWNDGIGRRNGTKVWTFSAKKPYQESPTIYRAIEWLNNLGFTNLTFELVDMDDLDTAAPENTNSDIVDAALTKAFEESSKQELMDVVEEENTNSEEPEESLANAC